MVDDTQAIPTDTLLAALTYAVSIKIAQAALGHKSRSGVYEAAVRGELDLVKDGGKTLVTVESIRAYQAKWPRANVKLAHVKPAATRSMTRGPRIGRQKPPATGRRKQPRQTHALAG
jgi:hypothetical protein